MENPDDVKAATIVSSLVQPFSDSEANSDMAMVAKSLAFFFVIIHFEECAAKCASAGFEEASCVGKKKLLQKRTEEGGMRDWLDDTSNAAESSKDSIPVTPAGFMKLNETGRCVTSSGEEPEKIIDNSGGDCSTKCAADVNCYGYSILGLSCLLWMQEDLKGGGSTLGKPSCYVKLLTPEPTPQPTPEPTPEPTPMPTFATLMPGGTSALIGGRNGKYCADQDDKVVCDRPEANQWEKFTVEDAGDNKIALKGGQNGKYCRDKSDKVKCNKNTISDKEKFSVEDAGEGKIALRGGREGKYCADEGTRIICDRNAIGAWEKFTVENQ